MSGFAVRKVIIVNSTAKSMGASSRKEVGGEDVGDEVVEDVVDGRDDS
jgi:hypothetical protein